MKLLNGMSSKKSWSMAPPPKPEKRAWAPALAPKKPAVDPYDPEGQGVSSNYAFLLNEVEDELVQGTWTTIDPATGTRQWDRAFREQQQLDPKSENSSSQSHYKTPSNGGNVWDGWAQSSNDFTGTPKVFDMFSTTSTASSEDHGSKTELEVRRHFVDVPDIMLDQSRHLTEFERRNRSSLVLGGSTKVINMIDGEVVSICHQPIDDRAKYRDEQGNYIDGIDRGKMKKRYETEWQKRLQDRKAEIKHVAKLKEEWDALPPVEQARRTAHKVANSKLVEILGAGFDSTRDLSTYEGEDLPEVYRRVSRWAISDHTNAAGSRRASNFSASSTDRSSSTPQRSQVSVHSAHRQNSQSSSLADAASIHDRSADETDYVPLNFEDPSQEDNDFVHSAGLSSPISRVRQSQDFTSSSRGGSGKNKYGYKASDKSKYDEPPRHRNWEPQKRRHVPASGKRKRTPSDGAPRPFTQSPPSSSAPSTPKPRALELSTSRATISRAPSSVITEIQPFENTPDLSILEDLPERDNFDDRWGAAKKFERVKVASDKDGRVVSVRLHEPVVFTSSAVCERLFSGKVQEIQYHPEERLALVVFAFPAEAAAFLTHVKNLRENSAHEYRRYNQYVQFLELSADRTKGYKSMLNGTKASSGSPCIQLSR